jgi:hypothetical protein
MLSLRRTFLSTAGIALIIAVPLALGARPDTSGAMSVGGVAASVTDAAQACSAVLKSIPMVRVVSGEPSVAGAYQITGSQLANYLESNSLRAGIAAVQSQWRQRSTDLVEVCLIDGNFETETPGPPGHDTSAARVLIVIAGDETRLWALSRGIDESLPEIDPKTLSTSNEPLIP